LLKSQGRLHELNDLKSALLENSIVYFKAIFSSRTANLNSLISIGAIQFYFSRFLQIHFNKVYFNYFGSKKSNLTFPLPMHLINRIRNEGFALNTLYSIILFTAVVLIFWCKGVITFVQLFFNSIRNRSYQSINWQDSIFFDSLSPNNLGEREDLFNIVSWVVNKHTNFPPFSCILHTCKGVDNYFYKGTQVRGVKSEFTSLSSGVDHLIFLCYFLFELFFSLGMLLVGRWKRAFMISETLKYYYFNLLSSENIARSYFFHQSSHVYRPLWTYKAEEKGSNIYFYLYATNIRDIIPKGMQFQSRQSNFWQILTWSHLCVWTSSQIDFFNKNLLCSDYKIDLFGSIPFSDVNIDLNLDYKYIAVFDVQPFRETRYSYLGIPYEYYNYDNSMKFLNDIKYIAQKLELKVILKRKRSANRYTCKKYLRRLNELIDNDSFLCIDSDVSAHRLIQKASCVITIPFSSTSLIANEMKIPACFYDSSGNIYHDCVYTSGIPFFSDLESLETWVLSIHS
jgi:polysaccharide biosynthesis PFTS motif protein